MSNALKTLFQSIANSIRTTKGQDKANKISPTNFSSEINKLAYIDDSITGKINIVSSAKPIIVNNNGTITVNTEQAIGYVNDGGNTATLELNKKSAETFIPTTMNIVINSGQYLTGNQTIKGEKNLLPENIRRTLDVEEDVNGNPQLLSIYGVTGTLDKAHRTEGRRIYNKNYVDQVLDCAKSYYIARKSGKYKFQYSQSRGLFNTYFTTGYYNSDTNKTPIPNANGEDISSLGYCCIDCSGFISLVMRGIDFNSSPYPKAYGKQKQKVSDYNTAEPVMDGSNIVYTPHIVKDLASKSKYDWADIYLDNQLDSDFRECGNYRKMIYYKFGSNNEVIKYDRFLKSYSIRNAAELAEYYYNKGMVIYEYQNPPIPYPSGGLIEQDKSNIVSHDNYGKLNAALLIPYLKGGELLFWSKPLNESAASIRQHSRFKEITHVGIVDKDGLHYYHVTGSDSKNGDTVFRSEITDDNMRYLKLIIRPVYYAIPKNTEINKDLLPKYHFDSCDLMSETINGITFTVLQTGGFNISPNIPSSSTTFYIFNSSNPIVLDPGTYILSGCPSHEAIDPTEQSTHFGLSLKDANKPNDNDQNKLIDINGNFVFDKGNGSTFKITEHTEVYVYFYVSANILSMNNSNGYNVIPKLIRTE